MGARLGSLAPDPFSKTDSNFVQSLELRDPRIYLGFLCYSFDKRDNLMKILFVCKGNVGRSQMAAALFTKYSGTRAFSAGTEVFDEEGQKLSEVPLAEPVIRFMAQEGVNVADNTRRQLTSEMVEEFDKIIVMAEPESIPSYLSGSQNVELWDIDNPKGKTDADYRRIVSQIKQRITALVDSSN